MTSALICLIASIFAYDIRADLPPDDGTEYVRQLHLWAGYVAMGAIDALTIYLLRWHGKPVRKLTNPLTIILGCSIINHAFGAFSYASVNFTGLDIYDAGVHVVTAAQVLVFWWWWMGRKYGKRDRRYARRAPSVNLLHRLVPLGRTSNKERHT